jgi:hypothetical protein
VRAEADESALLLSALASSVERFEEAMLDEIAQIDDVSSSVAAATL